MSEQENGIGRIVVGVDGSTSSRAALRWGVRQAGLTGASVEAITAWQSPALVGLASPFTEAEPSVGDDDRIRDAAERVVKNDLMRTCGQLEVPDPGGRSSGSDGAGVHVLEGLRVPARAEA